MKIESQVCGLELAKKLKELGVKQDSFFYYCGTKDEINRGTGYIIKHDVMNWATSVSAFTVAEIGRVLPEKVKYGTEDGEVAFYRQKLFDDEPRAEIFYADAFDEKMKVPKDQGIRGMTEADARARMLVYLLENGFLNPPIQN